MLGTTKDTGPRLPTKLAEQSKNFPKIRSQTDRGGALRTCDAALKDQATMSRNDPKKQIYARLRRTESFFENTAVRRIELDKTFKVDFPAAGWGRSGTDPGDLASSCEHRPETLSPPTLEHAKKKKTTCFKIDNVEHHFEKTQAQYIDSTYQEVSCPAQLSRLKMVERRNTVYLLADRSDLFIAIQEKRPYSAFLSLWRSYLYRWGNDKVEFESNDSDRITLMHWAAGPFGRLDITYLLLTSGCEVDPVDAVLQTPLHYAVLDSHFEVAELLIKFGADPYAKNIFRISPFDFAKKQNNIVMLDIITKHCKHQAPSPSA